VDNAFLKEQAERCRTLANKADPFTRSRLLDLAARYEDKLVQTSRASRNLGTLLEAWVKDNRNTFANGLRSGILEQAPSSKHGDENHDLSRLPRLR
jgi:hypothetical protein